jgi:ribonuclease HI/probable phosphoglycerate mutase
LERAAQLGGKRLIVHSDSELVVKQMNGEYRVKNSDLRILHDRAKELIEQFEQVAIRHVRREQNSRADELCNQALDGASPGGKTNSSWKSLASTDNHLPDAVRKKAIAHLRAAAESWAKGDMESPPPEAVWDELWRMLQENEVV